jgi:hypothetical protein
MLAKRLATLAPSATLAVQAKAKELKSRGVDVISFGAGEPWLDRRSRDLLLERALSGKPWLKLGRSGLEVDFPVTAQAASGALRDLAKGNDVFSGALLSIFRYLKIDAERTIARFGDAAPGGFVRLSLRRDDVTYSPALYDALSERGAIEPTRFPTEGEVLRVAR